MPNTTLSPREVQVLDGRRRGLALKQVALQLGISLGTTKTHLHGIFVKVHAGSTPEAIYNATPQACRRCRHYRHWRA